MELLRKLRRGLRRHAGLSAGEVMQKIWRSLAAMVAAHVYLADCDSVGARVRTAGRPLVENRGHIALGDDVTLNSPFAPVHLVAEPGASLSIGSGASLNFGTLVSARSSVRLGDRVRVGPYSIISDTDVPMPGLDAAHAAALGPAAPIEIGNDVWLGGRVTVLGGSRIGEWSVIGAGSVVDGDIPPRVIAAGNPARVIRPLPESDDA
jgi:acetyltransferase-like isoleucine patch superfamily enzyme